MSNIRDVALAALFTTALLAALQGGLAFGNYEIRTPEVRIKLVTSDGKPVSNAGFELSASEHHFRFRSNCNGGIPPVGISLPGYCSKLRQLSQKLALTDADGAALLPALEHRSRRGNHRAPIVIVRYAGIHSPKTGRMLMWWKNNPMCVDSSGKRFALHELRFDEQSAPRMTTSLDCTLPLTAEELTAEIRKEEGV